MPSYVIAGASRGLGLQFLKTLSSDPSNTIVALARTPSAVESQLPAVSNLHLIQADLTSPASLREAASKTSAITNGSVDYLIVNGAYVGVETQNITPTQFAGKEDLFLQDVDLAFKTNFAGPLFTINAFLDLVRKGNEKKVVVISSGMADPEFISQAGVWTAVTYSASKSAVNVLVAKFAVELRDEGIFVASLSPGLVDTDGTEVSKKNFELLLPMFRKYNAEFEGPITTEQSVNMQIGVIHKLNLDMSGKMWSHLGTQRWI